MGALLKTISAGTFNAITLPLIEGAVAMAAILKYNEVELEYESANGDKFKFRAKK